MDNRAAIRNLRAFMMTVGRNAMINLSRTHWKRKVTSMTMAFNSTPAHPFTEAGELADLPTVQHRWQDGVEDMDFAAPPEFDPYVQLQQAEVERLRRRVYVERLREIPPRARACVMLRLDGATQKEIATKLAISEHTVEQHLRKAYAILQGPARQMWKMRGRADSYFLDTLVPGTSVALHEPSLPTAA
jgi:RNA polymerase sigma factor (sigma-70 family)